MPTAVHHPLNKSIIVLARFFSVVTGLESPPDQSPRTDRSIRRNAALLVAASGTGPVAVRGEGQEGGRRRRRPERHGGAALVGDDVGRGVGDVRRRVLAPGREGHQPGLLHRLGGVRLPGGHGVLRYLRRSRPLGPLRGEGGARVPAAVAAGPLAGGRDAGVADRRRREAALRLPVRPVAAVVRGRLRRRGRRAPPQPPPRRRPQRLHRAVRRQAGRPHGRRQRRRLPRRPGHRQRRRRRPRGRPAHRRLQAQPASGGGAHPAVQRPRAMPRRRAGRAPRVAAEPGVSGAGHVARVRRLLRQGLRRHLGAGGDAEEDHQQGPVHHPRYRRGLGRDLQRRGRADRGGDAGQGEGGQAAGGVRRPRVAA